jgi:hypothetical protein
MPSPMPALPDLPDHDLPDTSYRPFKVPHAAHVLALAEAKARAEELAVRPTATRFLLLRQDGTVTRQCDDLVEARAWQRALVHYHVVISDDGRLMSFPFLTTEASAQAVAARWRAARVGEGPVSEVRMTNGDNHG